MPSVDQPAGARAIARLWRADETECVPPLIRAAELDDAARQRSVLAACRLIEGMRRHQGRHGLEAITAAFPLNSAAGLALLSLAEALLRVPDAANADRLLRDRLSRVDWNQYRSSGALGAALRLASACVSGRPCGWRTLTTPLVRSAMQLAIRALSNQFIFAHSIECRAGARRPRRCPCLSLFLRHAGRGGTDRRRCAALFPGLPAGDSRRRRRVSRPGAARRRQRVGETVGAASALSLLAARAACMRELLPRLLELARLAQPVRHCAGDRCRGSRNGWSSRSI